MKRYEYRYEYGKRWNAKLPRVDIKFLVNRELVSKPEDQIADMIEKRAIDSKIPSHMIPACKAYAIAVHRANVKLYNDYRF